MNGQSDTCSMLRKNLAVAWQWGVKFLGFHGIGHLFALIMAADNMPWLRFRSCSGISICQPLKGCHRLQTEDRKVLSALSDLYGGGLSTEPYG